MAVVFATKNGNWNDTTVWSNGAIPVSDDDVYANGFNIQLNADVNVNTLNNTASVNRLQFMNVPKMLNNTSPSGYLANASANQSTAYVAFDQNLATSFISGTVNNWLSFQYPTTKLNVRYAITFQTGGLNATGWRYEGSNDGVNYTTLHTVTGNALLNYSSPLLTFTTPYLYYRIFVTAQAYAPGAYFISFEMTEDTNPNPIFGQTAGGTFTNTTTRNIILNGTNGCIFATGQNATVITAAQNSPEILSITSTFNKITNYTFTSSIVCTAITTTGTGTTNITGDLYNVSSGSWDQSRALYVNSNATINIIGSLFGGTSTTTGAILTSTLFTTATITITGSVNAGNFLTSSYAIYLQGTGILSIIGTINAGLANAIVATGNSIININGIVNANAVNNTNGIYTAANFAIINLFAGAIINNKGLSAGIVSRRLRLNQNANVQWVFQDTANTDITLSTGTPAGGVYPTESDVRLGVAYAASPTRYGTCAVPLPQYVSQGVATGSTVGTAYINAADVWNVLSSSITTAGSIGERLKVASTVETTGDQLAAYIV
ncbi:hypothetical protein [Brevundimonas sp.]|jgi:hypothetical protein|uniref:hypothetical protein n=1 Tax=Brevundimonas sp. TaxID=1871086 RepID=UPI003782F0C0